MFQAAYTNNARIHQNSWGSDSYGAYDAQTREVDEFTFNNPEMLVCYSADNANSDANSDGIVDLASNAIEEYLQDFPDAFADIMAQNPQMTPRQLASEFVKAVPDIAAAPEVEAGF